jgi:hypothetical protein
MWALARDKAEVVANPRLSSARQALASAPVFAVITSPSKPPVISNVQVFVSAVTPKPLKPGTTKATEQFSLKPGIYKTEPFACIVLVPAAGLDEGMAVNPPGGEISMPTVKPELRFVPISPTGK